MKDEEFIKQIHEAFVIEGGEILQSMAAGLLILEQRPPAARRIEVVDTIFRNAHSLKGAAAVVDVAACHEINALCHELEAIFAPWKTSAVTAEPETFELLKRAVNLLGRLVRQSGAEMNPEDRMEHTRILHELGSINPARPGAGPGGGVGCH